VDDCDVDEIEKQLAIGGLPLGGMLEFFVD
jgi:hypothetical protein